MRSNKVCLYNMFASTSFSTKTVSGLNNANLNYLNVYNDANFYGTTTFYGPVNITVPIGFVNLTVTNQTTLNKLTVSGATIFNGPVTFNGTITLTDLTLNNLTVNGTSTLKGNVAVGTSIAPVNTDTFGPVELTGTLLQTGVSTFVGRVNVSVLLSTLTALAVTTGQTTLQDTFITNLVVSVSSDFSGPFRSHGYVILYDTLTVIGLINGTNQELTGTLTVTGLTTLNGGLDLTGALILTGDLSITGFLTVAGITTLAELNSGITNTGALTVTGGAVITGAVGITGATLITGDLTVNGNTNITGINTINGASFLNGAVNVTGVITSLLGIDISAGTLAVTIRATLGSINLSVFAPLASINLVAALGPVYLGGSTIDMVSTYNVNVSAVSLVVVSTSTNIGSTGAIVLGDSTGNATTINMYGATLDVGTSAHPITSNFYGDTHLDLGTFFVGSTTTAVNQVNYGNITIGDATHLYTLAVNGTTNLGTLNALVATVNTLTVSTTSTFTGLATFNGGISISGSITLGALTVTSLVVNTTSTFTGLATFNGGVASTTITASGLVTANTLTVTTTSAYFGTATFTGTIAANGLFFSNDVATFNAGITVSSGGILVSSGGIGVTVGPSTFLGNTFNVATGGSRATITMYASAIGGMLFDSAGVITITSVSGTTINGPASILGDFVLGSIGTPRSITMYGSAGSGILITSAGTLTLTGASNTVNGNTQLNGSLAVSAGATITGNTTVNGTLTIGPGGATRDLAVYGTAFLGVISQAGAANLDIVDVTSLSLGGVNQLFSGTYSPAYIATAGISFGSVSSTGSYSVVGSTITVSINLSAVYTGTSADVIQVSLPLTAPSRNSWPLVQATSTLTTFPTTIQLGTIASGINVLSFTKNYSISGDTIQVLSTFTYLL